MPSITVSRPSSKTKCLGNGGVPRGENVRNADPVAIGQRDHEIEHARWLRIARRRPVAHSRPRSRPVFGAGIGAGNYQDSMMAHASRTRGNREFAAQLLLHLAGERTLCERRCSRCMRSCIVSRARPIGPQLCEHGIALLMRQARELLADFDDVGRSRAGAALRERQLAPLAQHDSQQRSAALWPRLRAVAANSRPNRVSGNSEAHQYCSTGTPIT